MPNEISKRAVVHPIEWFNLKTCLHSVQYIAAMSPDEEVRTRAKTTVQALEDLKILIQKKQDILCFGPQEEKETF